MSDLGELVVDSNTYSCFHVSYYILYELSKLSGIIEIYSAIFDVENSGIVTMGGDDCLVTEHPQFDDTNAWYYVASCNIIHDDTAIIISRIGILDGDTFKFNPEFNEGIDLIGTLRLQYQLFLMTKIWCDHKGIKLVNDSCLVREKLVGIPVYSGQRSFHDLHRRAYSKFAIMYMWHERLGELEMLTGIEQLKLETTGLIAKLTADNRILIGLAQWCEPNYEEPNKIQRLKKYVPLARLGYVDLNPDSAEFSQFTQDYKRYATGRAFLTPQQCQVLGKLVADKIAWYLDLSNIQAIEIPRNF